MALILIVEDDAMISDIVAYNLNREGFSTIVAADGESGLKIAEESSPDLVLLDIMLPGMDGFEVLKRIRASSTVPVLMLTARESEDDRVDGLELGADDYIVKPFSVRELISRVRANLRRVSAPFAAHRPEDGPLHIDTDKFEVTLHGRRLDLSAREFELFSFLVANPGKVFSREDLLCTVWGYSYYGGTRVVDVAIRRLREKLEECTPGASAYIVTRHRQGYYFEPDISGEKGK